jgi:hypothetical protein
MAMASLLWVAGCADSVAGSGEAPDGTVGAGAAARAEVVVEGPGRSVLRVTNTSEGSARLDRLGLNLATVVPQGCLRIDSENGSWARATKPRPHCGAGESFALEAKSGVGLAPGDTVELRLSVVEGCPSPVALTAALFEGAPRSRAGEDEGQWGASFSAESSLVGCDAGDFEVAPASDGGGAPEAPEGVLVTWSEFVATAADENGLPSQDQASDSRAGSVELNFGGWLGGGQPPDDAPFEAAIVTLRNGRSDLLSQWQINRARRPAGLPSGGCLQKPHWECWVEAPYAVTDGALVAAVPMQGDSNDGFDDGGQRITVAGAAHLDYGDGPPFADNSHETMELTWAAPLGLETAQLLLRGRFDRDADGLDAKDGMVDLLRLNVTGLADLAPPFVEEVARTDTTLTVRLNVEQALLAVREAYAELPPAR